MVNSISMQVRKNPTYTYRCKMCGNCCRHYWDIILTKEDVLKWNHNNKDEFLKHIQINPISISPAGLGDYTNGVSVIEMPGITASKDKHNEFNKVEFEKRLEKIRKFVLDNHDYLGEGTPNLPVHSYFSFFYPLDTYFEGVGNWPIFRPRSFVVILEGMDMGVKYVLSFDSLGQCFFLRESQCSIQEIKPVACQEFPFDQDGLLRTDERVLDICRGITNQ